MVDWAKVKFFYQTMLGSTGSTLAATSTESISDYDVEYLANWLEKNKWMAEDSGLADPQYITYDAGSGNSYDADYLIIYGHNLYTAGATVALQYSTTGAWAGEEVTVFSEAPSADTVYIKEFSAPGAERYWRLKISGHGSTAPYMTLCVWGETTELDYMTASIDPHAEDEKANVNRTPGGYLAGTHLKSLDRVLSLSFDAADETLYNKLKTWVDDHGLQNCFVAWEIANNPGDVWLMMRELNSFKAPWSNKNAAFRDISFRLKGRKE